MGSVRLLISVMFLHSVFIGIHSTLLAWDRSSICRTTNSRRVSRYVPYIETYKRRVFIFWKTATRYNYRWEFSTEWYTMEECCPGFRQTNNECRPICNGGCPHGICIRPQECSCDVGYALEKNSNKRRCIPECPHGCIHGECTAPRTCTCDTGYEMTEDHHTCVPSCQPHCDIGSECISPNKCACINGYKFSNVTHGFDSNSTQASCEPICTPDCEEHSFCIKPDVCQCDIGFERIYTYVTAGFTSSPSSPSSSECVPICSPPCGDHSTCVAPHTCVCEPGYNSVANHCEPNCIPPCDTNGMCIAPNECVCAAGYKITLQRDNHTSEVTSIECKPICEPPCGIRGDCVGPDECSCEPGWQIKSTFENSTGYCAPFCEPPCGAWAECAKPNLCECHPGYEISLSDTTTITCHPICSPSCIHGTCISPGICKCDEGYTLDTSDPFKCEPVCGQTGCTNGQCTSPNICTCLDEYTLDPVYPYVCNPICEKCENGFCVKPNQCICNYGFEMNEDSKCAPICYGKCINGTCIGPNKCLCDPGFRAIDKVPDLIFDASTLILCQPICETKCQNATCTAPNVCSCNSGYEKNDKNQCIPSCDGRCNFGDCIAPNQCKCEEGYVEVDERNGELCQPHCENGCANGQCVSPNNCTCDEGYLLDIFNASLCSPVCEIDCGNGDCVAPNDCQCHDGFVIEDEITLDGLCVNPCKGGCGDHGICDSENRTCDCFYGWSGKNCASAIYCGIILQENDINFHLRIPDRNETNDTIGSLESVKWRGPRCNEKCQLERGNSTNDCYRLLDDDEGHDRTTTTIVCFLSLALPCNAASLQSRNLVYSGIAGTIVVIIGIACATAAAFLLVKRRRSLDSNAISSTCDNLLEQSETTDSLIHTNESSYL